MLNTAIRYGAISRILHWLMALMIVVLVLLGMYMTDLPKADPARAQIIALHKAFGALVLLAWVLRLAWLRISPAPRLPGAFSKQERRLIKGLQGILYALMFLAPAAGYTLSVASGHPVSVFGVFDLPSLFGVNHTLAHLARTLHAPLAYALLGVAALHALGAITHRLKDRGGATDVLPRML
ncbi:MAG: cytochrome b [Betaproteobacteria bacterium]|nr:cytochrome b [Betaproteobacteria bacterium]